MEFRVTTGLAGPVIGSKLSGRRMGPLLIQAVGKRNGKQAVRELHFSNAQEYHQQIEQAKREIEIELNWPAPVAIAR